jgi:hypothetical protein
VLVDKYGEGVGAVRVSNGGVEYRLASLWWKDLILLEEGSGTSWFKPEVVRKLGDGMSTSFWKKNLISPFVSFFRYFLCFQGKRIVV